jgi:hypothetical protein
MPEVSALMVSNSFLKVRWRIKEEDNAMSSHENYKDYYNYYMEARYNVCV